MTTQVDLILTGGTVLAMDAASTVIENGAVVIRGGVIQDVGTKEEILGRYRAAEIINSPGCTVMPGWVNTHTHLAMNVFRGLADDVTLEEFLDRLVRAELRSLNENMVTVGARAAMAECIAGGTTTALDMYWFPQAARRAAREIGFRLLNGPTFMGDADPEGRDFEGMLERAEAILSENQHDRPDEDLWVMPHSTYTLNTNQLERIGALAARFDARINTHASESSGELALVNQLHNDRPVAVLADAGLVGPQTVLAHAVHLTDAEIIAIAHAGSTVAHCPVSNLKLGCGVARVPQLLQAGAAVALGTDGAASAGMLDMFQAARMAALLHKGVAEDPTLISAERAIRLGTVDGARGLGLQKVGTLEAGMVADLQVVRTNTLGAAPGVDPWSAVVYGSGASDVQHTIVNGRIVMRDRVLQTIDEARALDDLVAVAAVAQAAVSES
ncbi:amidohydrolase [Glaciibacter superstes]|uniref:amidohydrolase n=1 Tax=Glaciibacter superstes TaxID=501023 RepID=UPI0003B37320|nr:amidohydrolase [Glaciibacter superstes]